MSTDALPERRGQPRSHIPFLRWTAELCTRWTSHSAVCLDVSAQAMGLRLARPLPLGSVALLTLSADDGRTYTCLATIARTDDSDWRRVGVCLDAMDADLARMLSTITSDNSPNLPC
ncbi:PilZ domain-containing protein [Myxococcota bacterium]